MNFMNVLSWLWKRKWQILLGGMVVCVGMILSAAYQNYYTYSMRVSYIYPKAVDGLYPDGKRFLPEDLVKRERVVEAMEAMNAKGWYMDLTVDQVFNKLMVTEFMIGPVQEKVDALRSAGKEYTYYNNEYILSFHQPNPLHAKNAKDFFGVLRDNRSKEFVEALYRANAMAFLRDHTEGNIFLDFSDYLTTEGADYDQVAESYDSKTILCINYLTKKRAEDSNFVSHSTGKSFNDLIIGYQSLMDVEIKRLYKYASASKTTQRLAERINRYKVNVEQMEIYQKKKQDEHDVAKKAMMEYDHTFSENIIIVSVNEQNGLYQARPKTAYDTVTQRALNAGVEASTAANNVAENERLLREYQLAMSDEQTAKTMQATANTMVSELETKYHEMAQLSAQTIADYINEINMSYVKTTDMPTSLFGVRALIKWMLGFGLGAVLVALFCLANDWKREQAKK